MQTNESKTTTTLREVFLLLASALIPLSAIVVTPSLPAIASFFSSIPNIETLVKLVITIPALAVVVGSPLVGMIIDRWGRRKLLIGALILYGLSGTSGFFLNNIYIILVFRFFLGIAVAGIMTCTTTLIADYYTGTKRNRVMGFQATVSYFTAAVFVIVGGAIADIGWIFPFLIYLIAFIFLPGVILFLYEPVISTKTEMESVSETKQGIPYKTLIIGYIMTFIFLIEYYLLPTQIPFYLLETIEDISRTRIGIAIAALTIFAGISAINYKVLRSYINLETMFIIALILIGSGYLILMFAIAYWVFIVGLVISGLGVGIMFPNVNIWTVKDTPERVRGRALSILSSTLFLGAFLSPIINDPIISKIGFSNVFLIGSIVFFALISVPIVLIGIKIYKRKNRNE